MTIVNMPIELPARLRLQQAAYGDYLYKYVVASVDMMILQFPFDFRTHGFATDQLNIILYCCVCGL